MRILFLIESLRAGGKERRLIELIKGLNRFTDFQLGIILFSKEIHYTEIYDLKIDIKYISRKNKWSPYTFCQVYNICKEKCPDIIHSWGSLPSIYSLSSVIFLKIKFVNGMITKAPAHLSRFSKEWRRGRISFPFSNIVVANSFAGLKSYKAPRSRSMCIHNGFDFYRLNHIENIERVKRKFEINTTFVVGMVGAFVDKKDYITFLKLAMKILDNRSDITFLAIGDGPNLEKCKSFVADRYMKNIVFTGLQKDVESLINTFDIGVLITNPDIHGEGISNAIMEYMALSKPVIATRCGGNSEIIEHGKTGFLINNKSVNDIVDKIYYLMINPKIRISMGRSGRNLIETRFNLKRMTIEYINIYNSLKN